MHPSPVPTTPSPSSTAPPRAHQQRQNRKSGLTAAIQKSGLQSQSQTQPRPAKFQSQQSQNPQQQQSQRSIRNGNQTGNQQRSSPKAGAASKSVNEAAVQTRKTDSDSKQVMTQQTQPQRHQHDQQQQQQQNRFSNQRPRPQSQPQSKARRVQRRKEIESMTESLATVDLDLALSQSPPQNPSSPPSSSSDSSDSESARSRTAMHHREGFNKGYPIHLTSSPLQRPSSAPVMAQSRQGTMNASPRMDHLAPKARSPERNASEKKGLYAGPTFHNSPAPTSLPIPAFTRSLGNSPVEPPVERLPSAPFFAEAASPQLNNMRIQEKALQYETMGWPGMHQSMPVPPSYGHMSMGGHYNVPERMATSSYSPSHPPQQIGRPGVDQLSEISQNLPDNISQQQQQQQQLHGSYQLNS
ncbi:hypothetical protein EMPS_03762 [Entomortierella parvispora]|uniref:Uncharacterized protein n=1 Tax=Entomortierella parvispora TaxID=205924 RepID=A0A9P3H7E2_9FUNG|nr:hypothetical protein EMPS_03762 [Entomortierella parvispora]